MNNLRDKLFKAAFSERAVVASLVKDLFPPELANALNTDTLVLTANSYIDESLENILPIWLMNAHSSAGWWYTSPCCSSTRGCAISHSPDQAGQLRVIPKS